MRAAKAPARRIRTPPRFLSGRDQPIGLIATPILFESVGRNKSAWASVAQAGHRLVPFQSGGAS